MRLLSYVFFFFMLFACLPFLIRIFFFAFLNMISWILKMFRPPSSRNRSGARRPEKDGGDVIDVKYKVIK